MSERNGKRKEDRKESDSDDIDSLSDNPEDEEEVASEEEESEKVARPVKKGPAFGAAASKRLPLKKHKYLEPTGRMTDEQAEKERQTLVGKKRLHRQDHEDEVHTKP